MRGGMSGGTLSLIQRSAKFWSTVKVSCQSTKPDNMLDYELTQSGVESSVRFNLFTRKEAYDPR